MMLLTRLVIPFRDGTKGLRSKTPGFIDKYEQEELQFLFHLRADGICKDYVALFQGCPKMGYTELPLARFRKLWEQICIQMLGMSAEVPGTEGDVSLLRNVAELVQTPQGISIPSLVWLDRVDRLYGVLPQSLYFSKSFGFVFRGAAGNGKGDVAFSDMDFAPKSADNIVQNTPEFLNDGSCHGEDDWVDWLHVRDAISRSSIRLNLTCELAWLSVPELDGNPIQILDLLVGPIDFDSD
ncbi:MAG: hypothetical protein ACR2JE_12460 [Acidobacteriaceae bacterium]